MRLRVLTEEEENENDEAVALITIAARVGNGSRLASHVRLMDTIMSGYEEGSDDVVHDC